LSCIMQDGTFNTTLAAAADRALAYLNRLDQMPVAAPVDLGELRERLDKPLADSGVAPEIVIEDLAKDVEGAILGCAGGRFFGWVIGGSLPAALAADWLTSTWDQNAALYACGPAAAVAEEVAGRWLKELLDLPADASFAFVTGTQMAHFTCLAAARHALLSRAGWDVERDGLCGAPRIRILCNGQRHGSIERAVRSLGLGSAQIVDVPTDAANRVLASYLRNALEERAKSPLILVLAAGDICTGAFDDFKTLIPLAKEHGAWVHVDGAFGLWARASQSYRKLADGVELADSWTTDGHKWLNVPFDCGYAFVADPEAHRAAMSHRASYLTHDSEARDQIDWNPEWSRRARGFPTYAAIRQLGRTGIAEQIERSCELTRTLVERLTGLPGVEVMSAPVLNQALVRFLDPSPGATPADHDRRTEAVIAAIAASGEAFFTGATWNRARVMRISLCNWNTGLHDIQRAANAVAAILERSQPECSDEPTREVAGGER
jgi:glutamate/tyrosine decarboxylase-like PLP-dependent enzyme